MLAAVCGDNDVGAEAALTRCVHRHFAFVATLGTFAASSYYAVLQHDDAHQAALFDAAGVAASSAAGVLHLPLFALPWLLLEAGADPQAVDADGAAPAAASLSAGATSWTPSAAAASWTPGGATAAAPSAAAAAAFSAAGSSAAAAPAAATGSVASAAPWRTRTRTRPPRRVCTRGGRRR